MDLIITDSSILLYGIGPRLVWQVSTNKITDATVIPGQQIIRFEIADRSDYDIDFAVVNTINDLSFDAAVTTSSVYGTVAQAPAITFTDFVESIQQRVDFMINGDAVSSAGVTTTQLNTAITAALNLVDHDKRLGTLGTAGDYTAFPVSNKGEWLEVITTQTLSGYNLTSGEWWMCDTDNTAIGATNWFRLKQVGTTVVPPTVTNLAGNVALVGSVHNGGEARVEAANNFTIAGGDWSDGQEIKIISTSGTTLAANLTISGFNTSTFRDGSSTVTGASFNIGRQDNAFLATVTENPIGSGNKFLNIYPFGTKSDSLTYKPTVKVSTYSDETMGTNDSITLTISGTFLDYVNNITITGQDIAGITFSENTKKYDKIELDISSNNVEQQISINLESPNNTETVTIDVSSIVTTIPSLTGTGTSLWYKSNTGTNNATLGDGSYSAYSVGNGWDEHASYGGFIGFTKLTHKMTITRLSTPTTGYCYVSFSDEREYSTNQAPSLFINGNTMEGRGYNDSLFFQNVTVAVGDEITVIQELNRLTVLKNGGIAGIYDGAIVDTTVFVNFTAWQTTAFNNISTIIE